MVRAGLRCRVETGGEHLRPGQPLAKEESGERYVLADPPVHGPCLWWALRKLLSPGNRSSDIDHLEAALPRLPANNNITIISLFPATATLPTQNLSLVSIPVHWQSPGPTVPPLRNHGIRSSIRKMATAASRAARLHPHEPIRITPFPRCRRQEAASIH